MSRDTDSRTNIVVDGQPPRRQRVLVSVLAGLAIVIFGGGATLPYYVDALWFESLGYTSVFWTRLNLEAATFGAFALITFLVLYGAFLALKPARLDELIGGTILINRQRVKLPVESVAQSDRARPVPCHRRRDRRQHDGSLDDTGALVARAA